MPSRLPQCLLASLFAGPALAVCPGADPSNLTSVEFIGMPPPATSAEKADAYSSAVMRATCAGVRRPTTRCATTRSSRPLTGLARVWSVACSTRLASP